MATSFRQSAACGGIMLAIAALGGAALQPVWAGGLDSGLGGGCCADLEARIAELEATTAGKGNRRVSVTLSGWVWRALMYWDDGFQADLYSVDNGLNSSRFRFKGEAKIAPQYTAGFLFEMDIRIGARSDQVTQIDDDGVSGSGGSLGSAPFGDGIDSAGEPNQPNSGASLGGAGDSVIGIRQANWWLESASLGRLTVGRMTTATNDISTIDLSNAGVVVTSDPGRYQGAFLMRNGLGALGSSWSLQCGGPAGAGPYSTDCAEHGSIRRDAVRYDTPAFWGFKLGGSFGEDDFWDVALRYASEHHGFRVAAGIGYRWYLDREPDVPIQGPAPLFPTGKLSDTERRHLLTSASLMHLVTGLFVSGAYTNYEFRGSNANEVFGGVTGVGAHRPDIPLWWLDAGIQKNWTGLGATTFYGEWGRYDDGTVGLLASVAYPNLGPLADGAFADDSLVLDSEVQWWGAGVVQEIDAAAMELFIAYRQYQANAAISGGPGDQIPGGLQDIWFIQAGARIQF